jgi:hypothetical protein
LRAHNRHSDGRRSRGARLVQARSTSDDRDVGTSDGFTEGFRDHQPLEARLDLRAALRHESGSHLDCRSRHSLLNGPGDADGSGLSRASAERHHHSDAFATSGCWSQSSTRKRSIDDAVSRAKQLPPCGPPASVGAHAAVDRQIGSVGAETEVVKARHGDAPLSCGCYPRASVARVRIVDNEESWSLTSQHLDAIETERRAETLRGVESRGRAAQAHERHDVERAREAKGAQEMAEALPRASGDSKQDG